MNRHPIHVLFAALIALASVRSGLAHAGPPFPILADQPIPGYIVTIWADPDIGEALFYVVLEPGEEKNPAAVSRVELWVEPVSGRLAKAVYPSEQMKARGHLRFVVKPRFDRQEFWDVGVEIQLADGTTHPLLAEVESTPPGLGRWGLLAYLFPFVLFGGLWAVVFVRKARAKMSGEANLDSVPAVGHEAEK